MRGQHFTRANARHRASSLDRGLLDANGVRHAWREAVRDARALATQSFIGGETWSEPLGLRAALPRLPAMPAERGDLMAALIDRAFRASAEALLAAGVNERREIAGPLLAAATNAAEAMLDAEIQPYLDQARRIAGETLEDD